MQAAPLIALAPLTALVLGAVGLGGGIYETLLVDPLWPDNPMVIQPRRGGINRGKFWMPVQLVYELALLIAICVVWSVNDVRWWVVSALAVHLTARAWSMVYFIPKALRFQEAGDLGEEQAREARRWTRLSRFRLIPAAVSLIALGIAITRLTLPAP